MLTFNVVLGQQGLLFRDPLWFFFRIVFFFNPTYPILGNTFNAKRKKMGGGLISVVTCSKQIIGSLSSDAERRTSTGSEVFSLLTCLDDIKFVFLSFFTVIEAIWLKIWAKPPSKNEKRPLPVDVRHSKTLLLKLPIKSRQNPEHKINVKLQYNVVWILMGRLDISRLDNYPNSFCPLF